MPNQNVSIQQKFKDLSKETTDSIEKFNKLKKVVNKLKSSKNKNFTKVLDKKTGKNINQLLILISGAGTYLTYSYKGWVYALIAFFAIYIIGASIIDWYIKEKIPKKCEYYSNKSESLLQSIIKLFNKEIKPSLITFGIFSIDDVLKKTDASHIDPIILQLIMDHELSDSFKKIEIAENKFIYECILPEALDNIEVEVIEFNY